MATKEELVNENAELKQKLSDALAAAEVKADETTYEDGVYVYTDGVGFTVVSLEAGTFTYDGDDATTYEAPASRVRDEHGQFAEPIEGTVYRYDGSGDMVQVNDDDAKLAEAGVLALGEASALWAADKQRLEVERDEARGQVARLQQQLKDSGALHGAVDNLKAPY